MAPAIGALVGAGIVDLAKLRSLLGAIVAGTALLVSAWWGAQLLGRTPDFAPGLGLVELALAGAAAVV